MGETRRVFTEKEIKVMEWNPSVLRVSEMNITYSPAFKIAAEQANQGGVTPVENFVQAGFNVELIEQETPKRCLERWRKIYDFSGKAGLLEERRGKGSSGRPVSRELSAEEKLHLAEARIKLLEAENQLLKKLEALERHKDNNELLVSSECFQLINKVVRKHGLRRVIRYLCKLLR